MSLLASGPLRVTKGSFAEDRGAAGLKDSRFQQASRQVPLHFYSYCTRTYMYTCVCRYLCLCLCMCLCLCVCVCVSVLVCVRERVRFINGGGVVKNEIRDKCT
jgi:hypothetical protein